jgi:hypothetical protein
MSTWGFTARAGCSNAVVVFQFLAAFVRAIFAMYEAGAARYVPSLCIPEVMPFAEEE